MPVVLPRVDVVIESQGVQCEFYAWAFDNKGPSMRIGYNVGTLRRDMTRTIPVKQVWLSHDTDARAAFSFCAGMVEDIKKDFLQQAKRDMPEECIDRLLKRAALFASAIDLALAGGLEPFDLRFADALSSTRANKE